MLTKDYFPQWIAVGEAFIGRKKERDSLTHHVMSGHHTLLVAPRRYGKTSLSRQVLESTQMLSSETNFFLARTEKAVERKILAAVELILSQVENNLGRLIKKISACFSSTQNRWTLGIKGLASVELIPDSEVDIPDNIMTAFNLLESILKEKKQKAILYFDEFQQLNQIENGFVLQGAIREFAQSTKHVVFIFSGSNQKILHHMFDDQSMPLFELCERVQLHRINSEAYIRYINWVAKKTFNALLPVDCIEKVLELTENHPKRVYNLCYLLWKEATRIEDVTKAFVVTCWEDFIIDRANAVRLRLSNLNTGQIKVLTFIAADIDSQLTGKLAQRTLSLSSPSIVDAIAGLMAQDYISKTDNKYVVVDPLVKAVLVKYELDNLDR